MSKLSVALSFLFVPALFIAAPVAAKPVEMVHDASTNMTFQVGFPRGRLQVIPSKDKRIHVVGDVDDDVERTFFVQEGNTLAVRFLPEHAQRDMRADLTIALPASVSLTASTVSANIDVEGTLTRVELNTVSGDVHARGRATEMAVNTVAGGVRLEERCPRTEVNTVSGDVRLTALSNEVEVNTISGHTDVQAQHLSRVSMSTVSGDIVVDASLAGIGPFSFTTQSADVTVLLPAKSPVHVSTTTFAGSVRTEVPSVPGGAPIDVTTFSGDISIRAKK